jgi:hypothetical protein
MAKDNTYTLDELNLTKVERELVVRELAERLKDVVYMAADEKIEVALDHLGNLKSRIGAEDNIEVRYSINFVIGDIIQIIGNHRRERESINAILS